MMQHLPILQVILPLLAAPFAEVDSRVSVDGTLVSVPYIRMTVEMLRQWGLTVDDSAGSCFVIPGRQRAGVTSYEIEPGASAASYFWAMAPILRGNVGVYGLTKESLQGDVRFVEVLEEMGCEVLRGEDTITVRATPQLRGVDVDMNDISDTVMTLGAVTLFAEGPTNIRNVGHIRHKETDRIAALATELRKLGATVDERDDGLTITPGELRAATIDTYDDHRMAMSLALAGLRVPGVVINDPGCVAKTYPGFWDDLAAV